MLNGLPLTIRQTFMMLFGRKSGGTTPRGVCNDDNDSHVED